MSDHLRDIVEQVRAWDDARERSQQKEIGWSQVAGCRRAMGYQLAGEWASDDTDNWRAIAGTALHAWLQEVRQFQHVEGSRPHLRFEVETHYGGVPGHADEVEYQADRLIVTDYKTTSLRSAAVWDDPAVLDEKFIQVQGYAAGLTATAVDILSDDQVTVRMLVIPTDGTFDDWRLYERPFDRTVADAAVERVIQVETMQAKGQELPRDKPVWWCSRFCPFASTCRPDDWDEPDLPEIEDVELAAAIEAYGIAVEQESQGKQIKERIAPLIRGLRGTARGWKVTTGHGSLDWKPDRAQIEADYKASGLDVPMRGYPKAGALRVTRVKGS